MIWIHLDSNRYTLFMSSMFSYQKQLNFLFCQICYPVKDIPHSWLTWIQEKNGLHEHVLLTGDAQLGHLLCQPPADGVQLCRRAVLGRVGLGVTEVVGEDEDLAARRRRSKRHVEKEDLEPGCLKKHHLIR